MISTTDRCACSDEILRGVVQTNGLNWVADFPRLPVLLLALQRFNRRNWDVTVGFPDSVPIEQEDKLLKTTAPTTRRFTFLQEPVSSSKLPFPEHVKELMPSEDPDVPMKTVETPATDRMALDP